MPVGAPAVVGPLGIGVSVATRAGAFGGGAVFGAGGRGATRSGGVAVDGGAGVAGVAGAAGVEGFVTAGAGVVVDVPDPMPPGVVARGPGVTVVGRIVVPVAGGGGSIFGGGGGGGGG